MSTNKTTTVKQSEAVLVSTFGPGDCFFKAEDTAYANLLMVTDVPPPAPNVIIAVYWTTGVHENFQTDTIVTKVSDAAIDATL